jgi:phasin family protein
MNAIPTFPQGLNTVISKAEELVAFSKGNLDALTESGQIWASGVQTLTLQLAATAKSHFEASVATVQAISKTTSVADVIALQSDYGRGLVATAVAESTKLTEASRKLAEQTLAPLAARLNIAAKTFSLAA